MEELKQFKCEPETLQEFFEMVENDLVELVDEVIGGLPRNVVGCDEKRSYIFKDNKYHASISAFFEKSFWYELTIKDNNGVIVFECDKY